MDPGLKVAVVILNWNGTALLERFIPALLRCTPSNVEIIVGDNASTDQSVSFLQQHFPEVKILSNEENYGYAGGYNKILERIEADYFILLNSDVEVTTGWVEPVIEFMEQQTDVAVCQPKILSWNHKELFEYAGAAGGFMDKFGYFFCRGRMFDSLEEDKSQYDDAREIFWASGAAFFVRVNWFRKAGGFDATLFAHMEEIDLCWRLKRMGQKIAYVPASVVYHIGGGTLNKLSPHKTYLNFRNNLILLYKNLENRQRSSLLCARFFFDFVAWLRFLVLLQFGHAYAINRAHVKFLLGLSQWKKSRKRDAAHTKAFDHRISSGFYNGSVVNDYFIHKKTKFSDLNAKDIVSSSLPGVQGNSERKKRLSGI